MAAKKVTRAAEEFIANHRADMSVRELAAELSLSPTTVQRVARKMGAAAAPEQAAQARSLAARAVEGGELELLKALAAHLWTRILGASDKEVARITREYTETLARITELERPEVLQVDAAQGDGDLFDAALSGSG